MDEATPFNGSDTVELPPPPQPDLPPPPPQDPPRGTVVFLAIAGFFACFSFFVAATSLQLLNLPFGLLATSLVVFAAAGLVFSAALNQPPARFTGLARLRPGMTLLAVLVGVANLPLANFLMGAMREMLPQDWAEQSDATTRLLVAARPATRVVLVLAAGIAAPIGEELFFRGWLQTVLLRRVHAITGVLLTATLFSLTHLDPVGFVARVELGVVFGLARLWTGALWPAVAVHAVHNLASTALLYLSPEPLAELEEPFPWREAAVAGGASLACTLVLLAILRRGGRGKALQDTFVPLRIDSAAGARGLALAFAAASCAVALLAGFGSRLPGAELNSLARPESPGPAGAPSTP